MDTSAGAIHVVSASGASLEHADDRIRAGFNLYTIGGDGAIRSIEAQVLDPMSQAFRHYDLAAQGRTA